MATLLLPLTSRAFLLRWQAVLLVALTAIKFDPELKAYYDKKALDGKSKMSVLNAARFKLLAKVVSVVKNDRIYVIKNNLSRFVFYHRNPRRSMLVVVYKYPYTLKQQWKQILQAGQHNTWRYLERLSQFDLNPKDFSQIRMQSIFLIKDFNLWLKLHPSLSLKSYSKTNSSERSWRYLIRHCTNKIYWWFAWDRR